MPVVSTEEYVAPDSTLAFMLGYWRGWWRIIWHWSKNPLPFKVEIGRHDHPYAECGKRFASIHIWRLMILFNCETIKHSRAYYREMFKDDIRTDTWPDLVVYDILDADEIG